MGMFDDIRCNHPLPNGAKDTGRFQTKAFDCQMEKYTITEDGRLIHHTVRYETVPLAERPDPQFPEFGCIRTVPTGDVEIPHHGDVYFGDGHVTYIARFTNGRVEWIKPTTDEKTTGHPMGPT